MFRNRCLIIAVAQEKLSNLMEMLRSRVGLDENNSVITMRGVRIAIFVDGSLPPFPS